MAESELGVATLRIVADTREALAALETLRAAVGRGVGDTGNFFSGIEQQARNAGESAARAISTALRGASAGISFNGIEAQAREAGVRASRALRSAVTSNATNTRLSFGNIDEALGFAQALSGTVDDLREYRTALQSLRDGTSAAAPGFSQLNNAIAEIGQTIRNFSSSSNELTGSLTRNREAAVSPELRELAVLYGRLEGGSRRAAIAQAELARDTSAVGASTEVATRRVQTFAQVLSQIPGASLESINRQIASLQEGLGGLSIRSQEFLQRLTGIAELEIIRDNRLNRQRANANFNAFSTARVGPDAFGGLPELPPTVAGDLQLIDELNQRLRNVDQSSAEFEITQRALEQTQRRVQQALSGTSASFRELQQAEERAIRRREKLAGIQAYYADLNPRGGGVRNETGALLARGANSASDERAYRAALGASRELLENDLTRLQVLRQISQRILDTAAATKGGFGSASATGFGTNDPVQKSVRRNQEKVAKQEERAARNLSQQEQDLADVIARRTSVQESLLQLEQASKEVLSRQAQAALKRLQEASQTVTSRQQAIQDLRDATAISTGRASPIDGVLRDGSLVPGSPAFRRDAQRRNKDATGSALIGGAFPLLFGQGIGASVGGGLGGFAGGKVGGQFGFGLSLVGTAIGAQLDAAVAKLGALGSALSNPVEKFSELQQAGVLSSKSLEGQVQSLIAVGREAEAAALIQQDLARTYGDLSSARELAAESDKLNRTWSQLQVTVAGLAATGVTGFLEEASAGLRGFAETIQFFKDQLPKGLPELPKDLPLSGLRYGGIGLAFEPLKAAGKLFGSGGIFNPGGKTANVASATQAEKEKVLRSQIQQLTLDQIKAEASGNTGLNTRLQLKLNELKLEQELARLRLKPNSGPEQQQARENAQVERTRIQEQAKAAARVLASQVKSKAEISNSEKLVTAQLNGYERQSLELEKQLALNERNRQLLALPPELRQNSDQARVIEQQAALRIFEINQRIAKNDEQRWADSIAAANKIAQIQRQTAITAQQRDVGAPGIQALQALEQLRVARDAEREAQARLRVRPGDQALRDAANQAAEQTKAAAELTRQTLIDAYTQAKDAARQIGRSIEDAANQLLRLQSGGDGLNAFLFGDARRQEQQTAFNALLPQFQQDRQTAASLYRSRGNESAALAFERLNFSGTLEQVNAQMLQFRQALQNQIRSEQDYQRLLPDGVRAQNALTKAEASLRGAGLTPQDTIPQLLTSLNELAQKKWNVTVNVDSKGNVQSFGDLLPSTF